MFEADEQTEAIVIYTEPGGRMEAELAAYVTENDSKLPIVAFMAGRFMDEMPGMSFGHAGTIVEGKADTAAGEDQAPQRRRHHGGRGDQRDPGPCEAEDRRGRPRDVRGTFIDVEVADDIRDDAEIAKKLEDACPVDIYASATAHVEVVEENLDECVLCELCIAAAPAGKVRVLKLYDGTARDLAGAVPELPEAERARALVARRGLNRRIASVEDSDTYVCRPHAPGEIHEALRGRHLISANRRGKSMWFETDGGPTLYLHLGIAALLIDEEPHAPWDRFALVFEDGGRLALRDKRRLGRAVLDPDLDRLGPDAADITTKAFRARIGRSEAPIKARLMDQSAIAGLATSSWTRSCGGPGSPPRGPPRSSTTASSTPCAGTCAPPCATPSRAAARTSASSRPTG